MFLLKVATFFLMALAVGAEKKIELQDIEEDNLRSEKRTENEKELDKSDSPQTLDSGTGPGVSSLDFMKNGLLRYFENSQPQQQQQRYVHQYAVTEPPERYQPPPHKAQYGPGAQQAMVGYLSNFPMQIYLVPQYYPEQSGQSNHLQASAQYQSPSGPARVAAYQGAPEAVQTQNNYIEVPSFVQPTGKTYVQQYTPPQAVTYVTYPSQPTATPPQATPSPVVAYHLPAIFQFNPSIVTPTNSPKPYYANPEYIDTNSVDELQEQDQKQFSAQTEVPFHLPTAPEFPRHYNSRTPIREDYRHHAVSELPHPNPLLLKGSLPHLTHIPKSLPMYRPHTKPVYQGISSFTAHPHEHYGPPSFRRRPTSLLDSYIPSSIQLDYIKKGLVKDPASAYEALASGRLPHPIPRHAYERGFLPNQMYHTAAGGITYGHYKRTPKLDKVQQK